MSEQLKQSANKAVQREISNGRFSGDYDLSEFEGNPHFKAGIEVRGMKKIKIKYNPAYETQNPGKTQEVLKDITRHEINHRGYSGYNGCPRNLDYHVEKIVEPISDILTPRGFGSSDIHYVANVLEDTLLHVDLNNGFALEGITGFLADVGESCEGKTFTPFYEAHARLNLTLWGNKQEKREISRYFTRDNEVREKVVKAIQGFLEESGISDFKTEIRQGAKVLQVKDRKEIRGYINNPENWRKISEAYAKHFSELMTPSYAMPLLNHSGEGTKGQEQESEEETPAQNKPSQETEQGNEFDKEMESQEYKAKRMQKAYAEGKKTPSWIDSFEGLDLLYQSLAKKLQMKVQSYTQEMKKPVHFYGTREFDPEKDNFKHTRFGFDEDTGRVELKKKKYHEDMSVPYKKQPRGFPEARFCLMDTSRSMRSDVNGGDNIGNDAIIPWGDKSKYHFALLGWYGFLEYLRQNHLLSQMSVGLGNFSNQTIMADGLEEAKRLALKPQFGKTHIDEGAISGLFEGREKLVFTISDGEIENWHDLKDNFTEKAKQHQYFHLQIGSKNATTRDMEKAGLRVEYIRDAEDLARKVIDLTDILYRGEQEKN